MWMYRQSLRMGRALKEEVKEKKEEEEEKKMYM